MGEYKYHDVQFYNDTIRTLVTVDPSMVSGWISGIEYYLNNRIQSNNTAVVGLDAEWYYLYPKGSPNPVATLQLCVNSCCLIYQLIHTDRIPEKLYNFLSNRNYTFVGKNIASDLDRLYHDYGLGGKHITNAVDLGDLAEEHYGDTKLKNYGLKDLVSKVLHKEMEKAEDATLSRWDNRCLTIDQVKYACIDAFVSYATGYVLINGYSNSH